MGCLHVKHILYMIFIVGFFHRPGSSIKWSVLGQSERPRTSGPEVRKRTVMDETGRSKRLKVNSKTIQIFENFIVKILILKLTFRNFRGNSIFLTIT